MKPAPLGKTGGAGFCVCLYAALHVWKAVSYIQWENNMTTDTNEPAAPVEDSVGADEPAVAAEPAPVPPAEPIAPAEPVPPAEPAPVPPAEPAAIIMGNNLRDARVSHGYDNQADLCAALKEQLGVSMTQQTLSLYERGIRYAPVDKLLAISELLDISMAVLVAGTGGTYDSPRKVITLPAELAQALSPLQSLPSDSDLNTTAAGLLSALANPDPAYAVLRVHVGEIIEQFGRLSVAYAGDSSRRAVVAAATAAHVIATGSDMPSSQPQPAVRVQPQTTAPPADGSLPPGYSVTEGGELVLDLQKATTYEVPPLEGVPVGQDGVPTLNVTIPR